MFFTQGESTARAHHAALASFYVGTHLLQDSDYETAYKNLIVFTQKMHK